MTFDSRTECCIVTLLPAARDYARKLMVACLADGIRLKIISGSRTYAEQDSLYARGRTVPGLVVTDERGGYSWHNFGIAWDIGIFDGNGHYIRESHLYARAGEIGKSLGLEWGGDWYSRPEEWHFQLKIGLGIAQCREIVAAGFMVI